MWEGVLELPCPSEFFFAVISTLDGWIVLKFALLLYMNIANFVNDFGSVQYYFPWNFTIFYYMEWKRKFVEQISAMTE